MDFNIFLRICNSLKIYYIAKYLQPWNVFKSYAILFIFSVHMNIKTSTE